jgi:hypothetical protein
MKAKRKTKIKNKSKIKAKVHRKQVRKSKTYSAYVLGIILVVALLFESALVLNTTSTDWNNGFSILDVSSGVSTMVSDVKFAFEPATSAAASINDFYNQAAVATTQLLDPTLPDQTGSPTTFVYGVDNFYQMAANQMASILDLSNYTNVWQPKVAGASITTYR